MPAPDAPDRTTGDSDHVEIYDTTLRDGAQQVGLDFTVADKLQVAQRMDELGVDVVEGGWPGSNPKDVEFFKRARDLDWRHARLAAFGATRRPRIGAESDPNLAALLESGAPILTLVGKSWTLHVTEALRTTYDENLAMVADSVRYLVEQGHRVAFDAEHFFDGYTADPAYALAVAEAAAGAGADTVVLCDTNGGTLPDVVADVVAEVVARLTPRGVRVGGHFHEDSGCSVANSLIAIANGASHVQGAANGYGERCGNADLFAIIAALELKSGRKVLPPGRLEALTTTAYGIAELANQMPDSRQPYVGSSAFATKAGLHASAIMRHPDAYSHVEPAAVGNRMQVLVSELAGRSNVLAKAAELGIDVESDPQLGNQVLQRVKELEHRGYAFEAADASFELLVRRQAGQPVEPFVLEGYRVLVERNGDDDVSEATVRVHVGDRRLTAVGEGVGPVHALDQALRRALADDYPQLAEVRLVDFKVRILDGRAGTQAVTRVLVTSADPHGEWTTIGVSDDVVTASWEALADGFRYALLRAPANENAGAEDGANQGAEDGVKVGSEGRPED